MDLISLLVYLVVIAVVISTLAGRVRSTWLRGYDISADVETNGDRRGRLLRRGEA